MHVCDRKSHNPVIEEKKRDLNSKDGKSSFPLKNQLTTMVYLVFGSWPKREKSQKNIKNKTKSNIHFAG